MREQFTHDPNKLKHIKGQEGPVRNLDKALVMATVENEYREMADMYEAYCTSGSAFETYPIVPFSVAEFKKLESAEENGEPFDAARQEALLQDQEVRKYDLDPELYEHDHPVSPEMYQDFGEWQKRGVSADYVRQVGEQFAEQSGAFFDYATSMEYKSETELKKDIARNVIPALLHTIMGTIQKDWTASSEVAQSPEYHKTMSKSIVNASIIMSALDELRDRKHPPELEEEVA